jgi:ABC-type multidrug transport system fused ATPase/permease subunit
MQITFTGGAAIKVMGLMNNQPDIDPQKGDMVDHTSGELQLNDVEFFYQMRPEQTVLDKVNLVIPGGKVCALVGK